MAYTMTQAEQLIYNDVNAQIKAVNSWGFWTTAATRRNDRMNINRIKDAAALTLRGPKKDYVLDTLAVLWANWMAWSDQGQSSLKKKMLAGLSNIRVALTLAPDVVTVTTVAEAQGQPLATTPTIPPGKTTTPLTGKILGLPSWTVYTVGGATILFFGWKLIKKLIRK